jgi:transposase
MNSEHIFGLALGLKAPWRISNIDLKDVDTSKELHISIDYESGHFVDAQGKSTVHDRVERKWKHLNFFEHQCYIHCRVPRVIQQDGKVKTVSVPWARQGSGFTLLFEAYSMCLIEKEMPINKVGSMVKEYPNRIRTIFNYWIGIAYADADHSQITSIGIDETSSKKGHRYLTIAVDMDNRNVIHATTGKDSSTIEKIANYLESKGCDSDQIENVCIDLSPSFISGVSKQFDKAAIIFDRYHVKQLLNKAMDTHRKNEYRLHQELKGHKYLFLKSNEKLSMRQRKQRNELLELLPTIGDAYRLKLLFDDFWDMDNEQDAAGFLSYWCDLVLESKIQPLIKFANTVKAHWSGIVSYTTYKITNGILEGTNSKIQLAKRRARGYTNTKNFINMIYFIAGKLKFNYPLYLT